MHGALSTVGVEARDSCVALSSQAAVEAHTDLGGTSRPESGTVGNQSTDIAHGVQERDVVLLAGARLVDIRLASAHNADVADVREFGDFAAQPQRGDVGRHLWRVLSVEVQTEGAALSARQLKRLRLLDARRAPPLNAVRRHGIAAVVLRLKPRQHQRVLGHDVKRRARRACWDDAHRLHRERRLVDGGMRVEEAVCRDHALALTEA